jgi:nitrite reductase/ring-hydroxylating ferredoxin subunit
MKKRFPFVGHPRGWYVVAESAELAAGTVLTRRYFDKELVVFRGEGGEAALLDAFCPHLGAHLGKGGCVAGETIRCPFHGWRFDGRGRCLEVPFAQKIPPKAEARSYPVREVGGFVFAWYDEAGGAPAWDPPALPELSSPDWLPPVKKRWTVRTHLLDTNENNCDRAHLLHVHGLLNVRSSARPAEHVLHILHEFETDMARLGMPGTTIAGTVEGTHTGLGVLTQRIRAMVEGLLVSTQTPIDEETVDLRFTFTVNQNPDANLAQVAAQAMWVDLVRDVEDDIRIWEGKAYLERPVLSEADGPIGLYRKWTRQFLGTGDTHLTSRD